MLTSLALAMVLGQNPKTGKKLVFDEEFSRPGPIDKSRWIYDDGPVYNHELEHYTSSPENSTVADGKLVVTALKEGGRITSARIQSKEAWRYGYFEIRAKVPGGRGTWPSVWMLNDSIRHPGTPHSNWPECGEIDIFEEVGFDPNSFHFSLHCGNFNWMRKQQRTKAVTVPNGLDYHVYGLDWQPGYIRFLMDGAETYRVDKTSDAYGDWPFRDKFFFIINQAIGGDWGGQKGVDDSIFPSRYYVDYIRVYQ